MKKAVEKLLHTDRKIADIATSVGYSDYCYFSKVFKKSYGVTPLQYKKAREA